MFSLPSEVLLVAFNFHVFRTFCRSDKRQAVDDDDYDDGNDLDAMEF